MANTLGELLREAQDRNEDRNRIGFAALAQDGGETPKQNFRTCATEPVETHSHTLSN